MICSVLIPSRARPEQLFEVITSLHLTANPKNFEVIVRIDDDDDKTQDFLDTLVHAFNNITIKSGSRLSGYTSHGQFYTECADSARGQWCAFFNDDTLIVGKGWDEQLKAIPATGFIVQPEFHQLNQSVYAKDACGPVPFVPTNSWKLLGQPAIPTPTDTMMYELYKRHGWVTKYLEGITLWHDRADDATLAQHRK